MRICVRSILDRHVPTAGGQAATLTFGGQVRAEQDPAGQEGQAKGPGGQRRGDVDAGGELAAVRAQGLKLWAEFGARHTYYLNAHGYFVSCPG